MKRRSLSEWIKLDYVSIANKVQFAFILMRIDDVLKFVGDDNFRECFRKKFSSICKYLQLDESSTVAKVLHEARGLLVNSRMNHIARDLIISLLVEPFYVFKPEGVSIGMEEWQPSPIIVDKLMELGVYVDDSKEIDMYDDELPFDFK